MLLYCPYYHVIQSWKNIVIPIKITVSDYLLSMALTQFATDKLVSAMERVNYFQLCSKIIFAISSLIILRHSSMMNCDDLSAGAHPFHYSLLLNL